jgi:hypothetical protein
MDTSTGLMILMQKVCAAEKPAWAGPIGALYCVALTFVVGPSIRVVEAPFLSNDDRVPRSGLPRFPEKPDRLSEDGL